MGKNRDGTMTMLEHFSELRRRLVWGVGAFLGAAIFAFSRVDLIRGILARPIGLINFIYISPPEAFAANLRLSLIAAIVLAFPVLVYQGLAFLFPALYRQEKKIFLSALAGVCILFVSGSLFNYFVFVPSIWHFFLIFSGQLEPYINISEYVTFICSLTLAFGLAFQMPVLFWILARMELITARALQGQWRFALLVILFVSAMITPPDIFSQLLMAVPLSVLYGLAVFTVVLIEKKKNRKKTAGKIAEKREMVA